MFFFSIVLKLQGLDVTPKLVPSEIVNLVYPFDRRSTALHSNSVLGEPFSPSRSVSCMGEGFLKGFFSEPCRLRTPAARGPVHLL